MGVRQQQPAPHRRPALTAVDVGAVGVSAETRLSAVVAGLKRSYNIQAGYGPFRFIRMGHRHRLAADINAPKKLLPFVHAGSIIQNTN
jgi:hypothetical protein